MNEKGFIAKVVTYFVGIGCRRTHYAYFNVLGPDVVLLSNSSTNKKGALHGDRFMNYGVSELSMHVLKFHDVEFLNQVKTSFHVPETGVYCIQFTKLASIINKTPLSELETNIDPVTNGRIIKPKTEIYSPLKHLIGVYVDNFHVISVAKECCSFALKSDTCEGISRYPYISKEIEPEMLRTEVVYPVKIDISNITDKNNNRVFNHHVDFITALVYDGLTVPSTKQFINKINNQPYKLTVCYWTPDSNSLYSMYKFENSVVSVYSIRPNVRYIPLTSDINIDKTISNFE